MRPLLFSGNAHDSDRALVVVDCFSDSYLPAVALMDLSGQVRPVASRIVGRR